MAAVALAACDACTCKGGNARWFFFSDNLEAGNKF